MSKSTLKVFIDRIEENRAVIVLYDDDSVKFNLPTRYLPEGVSEGDYLQVSFAVDKEAHAEEKQKIDDLLGKLKAKKHEE